MSEQVAETVPEPQALTPAPPNNPAEPARRAPAVVVLRPLRAERKAGLATGHPNKNRGRRPRRAHGPAKRQGGPSGGDEPVCWARACPRKCF